MAIVGGYRTHEDGLQARFRMPDLLTYDEMRHYFVSNYGVDVQLVEPSQEILDAVSGVGTLPASTIISDRDRERMALRRDLGIERLEAASNVRYEHNPDERNPIVELDSRTLSPVDFREKYGIRQEEEYDSGVERQEETPSVEKKKPQEDEVDYGEL